MDNLIKIPIGDWSGDGHGRCQDFYYKSSHTLKEVREAYFEARDKFPDLCPEEYCSDFEDSCLSRRDAQRLSEAGAPMPDEEYLMPSDFAAIVVWFIQLGNPEIKFEKVEAPSVPFYGYDSKDRHIFFWGYGVMSY